MTEVREIPQEVVDQAWMEVSELTAHKANREMNRLMLVQDALFAFVLECSAGLSPAGHELGLYMAVVIYRMYEKAFPPSLPRARPKDILQTHEQTQEWVEHTAQAHDRILVERILPNLRIDQPWVMQYVGECLFEPEDQELELSEEDQGQLFLIMKTVIDTLDQCATRQQVSSADTVEAAKSSKNKRAPTYQLKITLKGIRPPIWRRVLAPADISMGTLHEILQLAMGWTDSHLHQFRAGRDTIGVPDPEWDDFDPGVTDERRIRLAEVAPREKSKFVYDYDFGDSWEHDVLVEKVLPADPETELPVCVKGKRACPPEDCGGVYGYLELLATIADPEDPEHDEMLQWLGGEWDSEAFDPDQVNEMLRDFISLPG
jgi:hypothetical protein